MGVSSTLEIFTTLFGWRLYEAIWGILAESGLVWLPVLGILLKHMVATRRQASHEAEAGGLSLRRLETEVVGMLLVIVVVALPTVEVRLTDIQYLKPALTCDAAPETVSGGDTQTTYDDAFATLGGEIARAPLWWTLVGQLSVAVTSATVAAIPCQADLRGLSFQLNQARLTDPRLRQSVQEFTTQCFLPARAKLLREKPAGDIPADDTEWLGSRFFLETSGYYDALASRTQREGFPFASPRDDGYPASLWGYPSCRAWWLGEGGSMGLRATLIDEIDTSVVRGLLDWFAGATPAEAEDQVIKTLLRVDRGATRLGDGVSVGYGTQAGLDGAVSSGASALAATAGLALNAGGHFSKMYLVREAAPILQAFLLMTITILLGFLIVLSGYSIGAIITASVAYFAIRYWTALWAIAYWLDNQLVDAMTPTENGVVAAVAYAIGLGEQQWLFNFITSALYIALPLTWFTLLTWAGHRLGTLMGAFSAAGQAAFAAGAAGGRFAQRAVTRIGRR